MCKTRGVIRCCTNREKITRTPWHKGVAGRDAEPERMKTGDRGDFPIVVPEIKSSNRKVTG